MVPKQVSRTGSESGLSVHVLRVRSLGTVPRIWFGHILKGQCEPHSPDHDTHKSPVHRQPDHYPRGHYRTPRDSLIRFHCF